jgi:hypothetical protein
VWSAVSEPEVNDIEERHHAASLPRWSGCHSERGSTVGYRGPFGSFIGEIREGDRLSEIMRGFQRRPKDPNTMFAVNYSDGRTSYLTISPYLLRDGDHVVPDIVRKRQEKGEIPDGEIANVRRVR